MCCLPAWPSVVIFLLELEEKRTKVRGGADKITAPSRETVCLCPPNFKPTGKVKISSQKQTSNMLVPYEHNIIVYDR